MLGLRVSNNNQRKHMSPPKICARMLWWHGSVPSLAPDRAPCPRVIHDLAQSYS